MHFTQAVAAIQHMVGSVKQVQILYNDKDPLNVDLVINLSGDGIKLIFDPVSRISSRSNNFSAPSTHFHVIHCA